MVTRDIESLNDRYDAVLFDVGNTLVQQVFTAVSSTELEAILLPGVRETFEVLRGRTRLGVVSNTTTMTTKELSAHLQAVGLLEDLEVIIATADIGIHKPDPIPLVHALEKLGVQSRRTLYVGDNESDSIAAARAGMDFCYTGPNLHDSLRRFVASSNDPWLRASKWVRVPDDSIANELRRHLDVLVKPPGSLGSLEDHVCRIAAIQRTTRPSVDPCAAVVFCADHGVAEDDHVTPWPQSISATMARVIAEGRAASSVFAGASDVYLEIIDVGLASVVSSAGVRSERIRAGTENFRDGWAMSLEDVRAALGVGAATAERLIAGGSRTLCVGEVGMGNTTSAAILISRLCGVEPIESTGRGAGIDDETLARKRQLVSTKVEELRKDMDVFELLARVGGLEIVSIAGFIVAASSLGVPVVLDGVTTQAAACVAEALVPGSKSACIAGHRSKEPASRHALTHLGLEPLLDLELRLGEGTGALLAIPILRSVCAAIVGMATLQEIM